MNITCVRADEAHRAAYYQLHSNRYGTDWCFCVAWWTEDWDSFPRRTADQNRALREELFSSGDYDGYLLFIDDEVAGWCQCGPRDRLPKLLSTYDLDPDPTIWAYTCFLIPKKWHGRGLGHALLRQSIDDLYDRGVKIVQGYPRAGTGLDSADAWQGTEGMFQKAGFNCIRNSEHWPVYELDLRWKRRARDKR